MNHVLLTNLMTKNMVIYEKNPILYQEIPSSLIAFLFINLNKFVGSESAVWRMTSDGANSFDMPNKKRAKSTLDSARNFFS